MFNLQPQARNVVTSATLSADDIYDRVPLSLAAGPATQSVQVLNFRAVAPTYEKLTETTVSQLIIGDPNSINDLPTYSLSGAPDSINSPMLLNQLKLAAGYCWRWLKKKGA